MVSGKEEFKKKCAYCNKIFNPGRHKEKKTCSEECLVGYREDNKEDRLLKAKEGMMKKYGVEHISKTDFFVKKVKATKKDKYGDENYNNREKAKKTCKEKYDVENPMQLNKNIKKSKETKNNKYGDSNYNNREKAEVTCLEKYGAKHHLQSEDCIEKMKETNIKKHNIPWTVTTKKAKERRKETMLQKYGCDFFFESEKHKDVIKTEKLKRIEKILLEGKIEFDSSTYLKLRNKLPSGQLKYIQYPVQCSSCGHKFTTRLVNKTPICRKCNPIANNSKFQNEFRNFLNKISFDYEEGNRTVIKPLELDFIIPSKNISIELNGNYYHSEIGGSKGRKYHLNKSAKCNDLDMKLIHIYEDEWISKKEIVKSRVMNVLGVTEKKIYARKCKIQEVSSKDKTEFMNKNHIQGNSVDSHRIGLIFEEELVSVMTFSKTRLATGNKTTQAGNWELNRFCSKLNTNVIGGFEKLFNNFIKTVEFKSIITYADCRWSGLNPEKSVYHKCGFNFVAKTRPSYFYLFKNDYYHRFHRFTFNKQKLLTEFGGSSLRTEWEIAQENGLDRIWDCGTMKFEFTKQMDFRS